MLNSEKTEIKKPKEEITISYLFKCVYNNKKIVILLMAACFVLGCALSGILYFKNKDLQVWRVESTFAYVSRHSNDYYGTGNNITQSDITLAQNLTETVKIIVKSDRVTGTVAKELGMDADKIEKIRKSLSVQTYPDTQIMKIVLTWTGTDTEAVDIMTVLTSNLPKIIRDIIEVGSINLVDENFKAIPVKYTFNFVYPFAGIVIGFIISLIFCIAIIVLNIFKPTVFSRNDIAEYFNINPLGSIPRLANNEGNKTGGLVISEEVSDFRFRESYRMLSSILQHTMHKYNCQSILITSAMASEGKTTVAVNFADQISRKGKKVLLVDFDLRKPKLKNLLCPDVNVTLNSVIAGSISIEDAIYNYKENFDCIFSDSTDNSMVSEDIMDKISELKNIYDVIIFDTAPIGVVSDALGLAKYIDGAVFVIKYNFVSSNIISDSIETIENANIKVIGGVLNEEKEVTLKDRYYKNYGYYKKYGYDLYAEPKMNDKRDMNKN